MAYWVLGIEYVVWNLALGNIVWYIGYWVCTHADMLVADMI